MVLLLRLAFLLIILLIFIFLDQSIELILINADDTIDPRI